VKRAALSLALVAALAAPAGAEGVDLAPLQRAAGSGASAGGPNAKRYAALARAIARPDRAGLADDFVKMRRAARDLRGALAGDTALANALDACLESGLGPALAAEDVSACGAAALVEPRGVRRRVDAAIGTSRRSLDDALSLRDEGRPDRSCAAAARAARSLASSAALAAAQLRRQDAKAPQWHVVHEALAGALWSVTATPGADPTVYAVGSPDGGDALFLRGTHEGWVRVRVGGTVEQRNAELHWVAQVPGGGVWACGEEGRVVRYDPVTGEVAAVPSGTTGNLWGLWGSAPDDVWIVGGSTDAGGTVLRRFDGSEWRDVPVPVGAGRILYKIWGRAADDVWACGQKGTLLRWDGASWAVVETGTDTDLLTVHGADSRVTVVGQVIGAEILERQPSGAFASQWIANADSISAAGVFLPAKGDPWSVGYATDGDGAILRRQRGRWQRVAGTPPLPGIDLHAVHVDDTGAVWIVGGRLGSGRDGVMLHFGPRTPSSDLLPQARLAADVQPIFSASCTDACHAGLFAAEELDLSSPAASHAGLARARAREAPLLRVLPGRPSASYLWRKIEGSHLAAGGSGDAMPQGREALPEGDRDRIRAWILEGAPGE
jgi:hypothetical protein